MARTARRRPPRLEADPASSGSAGLLRRVARAAGRVADARARRAVRRRPQRHGQDDALQHDRRPDRGALRRDPLRRPRDLGAEPHEIVRAGVGYVPQGRRLWPSLSVDETLRLRRAPAPAAMPGRSNASIRRFRAWRSGATMAAASSRAASSRCWRSRARCSAIRGCWSWTSRPRASRR